VQSRELAHTLALRFIVTALVAGVLLWLYVALLLPPLDPDSDPRSPLDELAGAAVVAPLGYYGVRRFLAGSLRWLDERRRPTWSERDRLLRIPWTVARFSVAAWTAVAISAIVANQALGESNSFNEHLTNTVATLLGGFVNACATYLITERGLRPVLTTALAGDPPERIRAVGLQARLLLFWTLGTGIPVLAIGLSLIGRDVELAGPLWYLIGITLVAGGVLTAVVARSLSQPIESLRDAVRRVGGGDLDVTVPVDDAGEVGFLEAGFNQMAAGLRERERLHRLFGRHVGEEVAARALASEASLGGERREATALFVDLVGSTALADQRDPLEVVDLLNRFFAAVVAAVSAEGGWVNKFEGDGALCVFGPPGDQSDHAARALRAARALQLGLEALDVETGIGVSTGTVVAGNVGAEERYEYTASATRSTRRPA